MGRVILEVSPPASLASHHLHHYLPQQGINRLPQIDPSVSWENYLDTDQQLGSLQSYFLAKGEFIKSLNEVIKDFKFSLAEKYD